MVLTDKSNNNYDKNDKNLCGYVKKSVFINVCYLFVKKKKNRKLYLESNFYHIRYSSIGTFNLGSHYFL